MNETEELIEKETQHNSSQYLNPNVIQNTNQNENGRSTPRTDTKSPHHRNISSPSQKNHNRKRSITSPSGHRSLFTPRHHEEIVIENEVVERKQREGKMKELEDIQIEKRCQKMKDIFSKNEMITVENETFREIQKVIFDSNVHSWGVSNSQFSQLIENKSHLILNETSKSLIFICFKEKDQM